jgi:hypothetical protein
VDPTTPAGAESRFVLAAQRMPATVLDLAGREHEGVFFLRSGGMPSRVESLFDLLNDEEKRFLPFETGDGIEFVPVDAIVAVGFQLPAEEALLLDEVGALRGELEIEVVTGRTLTGVLAHEAPATARRLSDILNFVRTRFVTLLAAERAYAVRIGAILRVRPRD